MYIRRVHGNPALQGKAFIIINDRLSPLNLPDKVHNPLLRLLRAHAQLVRQHTENNDV